MAADEGRPVAAQHPDMFALTHHVLLFDDAIGPSGHGCAGEDAHAFARADGAGEGGAGLAGAGQAERSRGIGATQGIAIHRGAVEWRQIAIRACVGAENAPERTGQRHRDGFQKGCPEKNCLPGLSGGNHAGKSAAGAPLLPEGARALRGLFDGRVENERRVERGELAPEAAGEPHAVVE